MWAIGRVPPLYSAAVLTACHATGADPYVLGSYLVSEHGEDWTDKPEACSGRGACGPFQLVWSWTSKWGYRSSDRNDPWLAAEIAARIMLYSEEKTAKEGRDWNWRARVKCSKVSRARCGPVRGWLRYERRLRQWPFWP